MPAATEAAAKGAASSSRNVRAKPGPPHDSKEEQGSPHESKEEQGSPHDAEEKQVSPHDSEEEGDLRAPTPREQTGFATPTGYDTEPGAASRAEDDAGEADPQKKAS